MSIKQVGMVESDLGSVGGAGESFSLYYLETTEDLGRPFEFKATLLADDDIGKKIESLLGTEMRLSIDLDTGNSEERFFHGRVSRLVFNGFHGKKLRYQVILKPWIWFLQHSSDNRVFQDMTVPEIIKDVFGDHGESMLNELVGNYDKREYCVQYGETDFDFVSRLMEEEGIFYYFRHTESKYDLVLADADSSHSPFEPLPEVPYREGGSETARLSNFVSQLEDSYQVDTGAVTQQSYNFEAPSTDLKARTVNNVSKDKSKGELYEYGSPYGAVKKGEGVSKVRLQQQKARYRLLSGSGPAKGICAGYLFDLIEAPLKSLDQEYLVISTRIQFQNNELTTGMGGGEAPFSCSFRAIPSSTAFRSPSYTPKAVVRGPQTAVVVGPKGDDIYTDKFGRVKIQFHWDRLGKSDEKSSCMVRVSTAIAGSSFGMVSIPRIGQEVIVDFLEGDPDQPIIVGSVYNDENKLPYGLPDNMTQSGIKSRSTSGKKDSGKPSNFNELRFEDKKDSEEVFIQAERNFKRVVKNDDVLEVGLQSGDVKSGVGDQTIQIHNNRTVTLKEGKEGNDKLTIEKGDRAVKIEKGSDDLNVKQKISFEAGDEFVLKVGKAKLTMKKSGEITIEGMKISITDKGATKIKGMKVNIDSDMDMGIKAGMNTKVEGGLNIELKGGVGAKVDGGVNLDLTGGAMAKLKGGVTMIG